MTQLPSKEQLQHFLDRHLTTARLRFLVHGLLASLVIGSLLSLVAAWFLGGSEWVAVGVKFGLAITCGAAFTLTVLLLLAAPLSRVRNRADLCRELEKEGSFANQLVAAEEACRRPDRWESPADVSQELVHRLMTRAVQIASQIKLGRQLALPGAGRILISASLVTLLLLGLALQGSQRLDKGFKRLSQPWLNETYAPRVGLYLAASSHELIAGEDVVLAALDFGTPHQDVVCEVRTGSGLWQAIPSTKISSSSLVPFHLWETQLSDVRETFTYRFQRDGLITASRTVTVRHPPLMTKLAGRVVPPAYTELATQQMSRIPSYLEVLAGSRLVLQGRVNHPVTFAAAVLSNGDTLRLQTVAEQVGGSLVVNDPLTYSFHLVDEHGLENSSRLSFELAVAEDRQPMARLQRYADDGMLPVSGEVTLLAEAADDFGMARVDLLYRREEGGQIAAAVTDTSDTWQRATIWLKDHDPFVGPNRAQKFHTGFGTLDLRVTDLDSSYSRLSVARELYVGAGDLDLVPGDVLAFSLEALDNRQPGPPGRGRSGIIRLMLPSAAEILTAQATEGQDRLDDLEEIRERSRNLSDDLERLNRELKKDPLPNWARQQEMEAAITRQQMLQEELASLADQLQADLETLADNHLTSMELLEKMDQVAELLAKVHNEELEKLLAQLKEAMAKLSEEEISEAIAEVAKNQQEMVRRLDRALQLLKELAREQELEGMTSLLAKMIREQQELLQESQESAATPDSNLENGSESAQESARDSFSESAESETAEQSAEGNPEDSQDSTSDEELAHRQEALAREMERLEQQLQEALERLQEEQSQGDNSASSQELEEALQEALENLEKQQTGQNMQDAAQDLQQGERSQAAEEQKQALRDLGVLYHVLLSGQEAMQMAMQQFEVTSLRRLAADLLTLSAKEEEIAKLIPNDLRDIRSQDLTRGQFRIMKASRAIRDRLQELSTSNPMQIMRLLRDLDNLLDQLGESVENLESSRGNLSQRSARQSLGTMNRIVIGLLTQAHMQAGGSGGCPMPAMGEQLKQMAREQAGLNGMAEQLRQMMQQQGLSSELRAQMKRLESDQQGLADSARDFAELERELQEGDRILGDMGHMANEMEKVVRDINNGIIDEETLARQERILSRLLDAHNSARKRDFSTRRESRTAEKLYNPQTADAIVPDETDSQSTYRLRYQPVEKAPLEYRDLVRRYFHGLEKFHRVDEPGRQRTSREGGGP